MDIHTVITFLAIGTLALNVATIVFALACFKRVWRMRITSMVRSFGVRILFLLSLASIVGTLYMQYGGALTPCVLCWWQRIFMYPIAVISIIALFKDKKLSDVADYVLALSIFGALVASYQHLLQMLPTGSLIPCDPSNDCAIRSVFEFGYITIPWMALSVFGVIALIAVLGRKEEVLT